MPELPEVTTIVRGLNEQLQGVVIKRVIVRDDRVIGYPPVTNDFKAGLAGRKIRGVARRGKYILINLSGNKTLVVHLRMSGKLLIEGRKTEYKKHTHVIMELENGNDLRFNNVRKFGRLYLIDSDQPETAGGLAELGPEPLDPDFTPQDFKELFQGRRAFIKSLLLNQKFIAGMGNIYVDEALFDAGIKPVRKANSLSGEELENLYKSIRKVLQMGVKYRGTSFSDYVNIFGQTGDFQEKLRVYQRNGEKCVRCNNKIIREKISGRSTHYCPGCQK